MTGARSMGINEADLKILEELEKAASPGYWKVKRIDWWYTQLAKYQKQNQELREALERIKDTPMDEWFLLQEIAEEALKED